MILLKIDHGEHLPQVPKLVSNCMFLVAGLLKNVASFWRLQLVEVPKQPDRDSTEQCVEPASDLSKSEVHIVKHIGADHAYFVNYQEFDILEQGSLLTSLTLRHAHVGGAELEGERRVQGLPVNVA